MDHHTLELLDFEKVRSMVQARAACSLGKQLALRLEPSVDPSKIRESLQLTTEITEALAAGLTPPFGGLHDIRSQIRRAQVGAQLEAEELAEVVESLRAIGNLDTWLARIGDQFLRLGGLRIGIGEFSGVATSIEGCLDSRGVILDTASRRLSAIRREIGQVEERIQESLQRLIRSPEIRRILRYPNFTKVGHHYVLPVSKDHRGEIQGSVHRTSASNETVYIEPTAIAEQSAQLSFLRAREIKEIRRILRWLSAQVGQVAGPLLATLDALAELDLIFAKGRYSLDYRMNPPDLNQEGKLVLRSARHPLLEALFRDDPTLPRTTLPEPTEVDQPAVDEVETTKQSETSPVITTKAIVPAAPAEKRMVVPIDMTLGVGFRILVITGPNTGGKTVALKTVGLLAVMAQSGLHIPAGQGAQMPIFDDILADIGDEQSLEQSLSTFSSHVRRISEILGKATERSLVIFDELGAGTDPEEGAALGRSILDELGAIGCRAIVTTHIGDLKTYALTNAWAENAAVEFDVESLRPLYHVRIGDVGQSNALKIARRLNLSEHLVSRAEGYLSDRAKDTPPEWEALQKLRKEAEESREAALAAQAEAERTREVLAQRLAELQREAERESRLAEARAQLQVGDRVVVARLGYDRPGRLVKLDTKKKTAVVAIGHVTWDVTIDELIPQSVRGVEVTQMPAPPKTKRALSLERFFEE